MAVCWLLKGKKNKALVLRQFRGAAMIRNSRATPALIEHSVGDPWAGRSSPGSSQIKGHKKWEITHTHAYTAEVTHINNAGRRSKLWQRDSFLSRINAVKLAYQELKKDGCWRSNCIWSTAEGSFVTAEDFSGPKHNQRNIKNCLRT